MVLPQSFYMRPTKKVAKNLLGRYLVRKIGRKKIIGKIVEVEAYVGPHDKASHASRGRTPRTEIMFGPPGCWYIYLVYGMYHCLNVVTERKNYPAAVLIRALEPVEGLDLIYKNRQIKIKQPLKPPFDKSLTNGPSKVCQAFLIDKKLNGQKAFIKGDLNIEKGEEIKPHAIVAARRIGVDYAGEYRDRLWRFYVRKNRFVSIH